MQLKPKASGIRSIMEKYKWNKKQFASYLCINQRTFDKLLKEEPVAAIIILFIAKEFSKELEEIAYNT